MVLYAVRLTDEKQLLGAFERARKQLLGAFEKKLKESDAFGKEQYSGSVHSMGADLDWILQQKVKNYPVIPGETRKNHVLSVRRVSVASVGGVANVMIRKSSAHEKALAVLSMLVEELQRHYVVPQAGDGVEAAKQKSRELRFLIAALGTTAQF